MPTHLENSAVATGLKRSVFIPIPQKGNAKACSNYHTIVLISHASKGILKILQARLQQYVNRELPNVQACFRKGRGTRPLPAWSLSLSLPWTLPGPIPPWLLRGDLGLKEDENKDQQGRQGRSKHHPDGKFDMYA